MRLGVIGLGLLGGSLALDLRAKSIVTSIVGFDSNEANGKRAIELGLVDEILPIEELINTTDLIALAVPVDAMVQLLPFVLDRIDKQTVFDVASTKGALVASVENHSKRGQYVATHPMAGTEFSGPDSAIRGMFDFKSVIICDWEDSDERSLVIIEKLYKLLNMELIYMDSYVHDNQVAYVSHLSHISSFALALTVLNKEKRDKHVFELASGGFDSTVRLAKSSPDMWTPIFIQNKKNILKVLNRYIDTLEDFRNHLIEENSEGVYGLLEEANNIKSVLDKNNYINKKRERLKNQK